MREYTVYDNVQQDVNSYKMMSSRQDRQPSFVRRRCYSTVPDYIIEDLRETFDFFDPNSTGYISSSQLQSILKIFLIEEKTIIEIQNEIGELLNSSKFSWEDVLNVIRRYRRSSFEGEAQDLFRAFDRNNNGIIGAQDIKLTLQSELLVPTTEKELNEFIRMTGVENSGKLSYDDFRYFLSNIK